MPDVIINDRVYSVMKASISIAVDGDECECNYGSGVNMTMEWRLAFALLSGAPGPYDIRIPGQGQGWGSGEISGCELASYERVVYNDTARLSFERPQSNEDVVALKCCTVPARSTGMKSVKKMRKKP